MDVDDPATNTKRGIASNVIGLAILYAAAKAMHLEVFAAVALIINYGVFLVHGLPQDSEKFFDATGSLTYLSLMIFAVASASHPLTWKQIIVPAMVMIWCTRLGSFLLARIMRDGKDSRFDAIKKSAVRFLGVWTIQSVWCFLVASPALVVVTSTACATAPGSLDFVGWGFWIFAFVFEVAADRQKDAFRADENNKGKFITTGLWAYSRHPNYFGEILMWVGICVSGSSCFVGFQWLAWLSPLTTWVLLMKVSGVPMLETKAQKTWGEDPAFQWYMENTPCIIPVLSRPPPFAKDGYIKVDG